MARVLVVIITQYLTQLDPNTKRIRLGYLFTLFLSVFFACQVDKSVTCINLIYYISMA